MCFRMMFTQANVPHMRIIWFASYDYHINCALYDNHIFQITYDYHMNRAPYDYHMWHIWLCN